METLCGYRLNTVGVVVGWLGGIMSFIAVVIFSIALGNLDAIVKMMTENMENADVANVRTGLLIVFVAYLTLNLINLLSSVLLVVGTIKERHLLLLPWIINAGISLTFSVFYFIVVLAAVFTGNMPIGSSLLTLISSGLTLVIQYMIWSAIRSLYSQIQANSDQQQRLLSTRNTPHRPDYTKI